MHEIKHLLKELVGIMDGKALNKIKPNIRKIPEIIEEAVKLDGKNLPQKGNRYAYKQKVWVYMMNRAELDFDDWGKEGRLHLGVKMMEYLEKLGLIRHQNRKLNKCLVKKTSSIAVIFFKSI